MVPARWRPRRRFLAFVSTATLAASLLSGGSAGAAGLPGHGSGGASSCQLGGASGNVKHVIYIQFDNVHLARTPEAPNVPSDLEQMPHLLHFLESNGALLTNEHTPLIAHTATDILTSLTGVYGDRMGVPISNTFRYFNPNGTSNLGVSFAYWTDPIFDPTTSTPTDTTFNMLTAGGQNAPAPWVPFTRAGCDVGGVATANTVLENIATDIPTVFGATSAQAAEVKADPHKAAADFVGIGVHCAQGSSLCSSANGGVADRLPDEPGGYSGYQALFGARYVDPQVFAGGTPVDTSGATIADPAGNQGFPGFDGMSAAVSLGYVAAMQEHGIPVTYAYISDAHDQHIPNATKDSFSTAAQGPGTPAYVAQLKAYDDAFGTFFTRLAHDGITPANTLFVVTSDENDHFAGGAPSPAGCDGVTVPCSYSQIGEVNANLADLLNVPLGQYPDFAVHSDSAPQFYVKGNPGPTDPALRALERQVGSTQAFDPYVGSNVALTRFLSNPTEDRLLHTVTADPARTPSFTLFANPDFFLYATKASCNGPSCTALGPSFAWNHGDVSPDINVTWLGLVGPGVRHLGASGAIWSDHTDIRPTIMALTGLKDDYVHDGRVLWEALYDWAVPPSLRAHRETLTRLAQAYKQLDASVGDLGLASLAVSTRALASGSSSNDSTFTGLEAWLGSVGVQRDALAARISTALNGAEFDGQAIDNQAAKQMTAQAWALIHEVQAKAANP